MITRGWDPEHDRYLTWLLIHEPMNRCRTNRPIYVFINSDGTILDWDGAKDCAVRLIQGTGQEDEFWFDD